MGREPTPPGAGAEQHVSLPQPVKVYVTYLTVQPLIGETTLAADIYGRDLDAKTQTALLPAPASSGS